MFDNFDSMNESYQMKHTDTDSWIHRIRGVEVSLSSTQKYKMIKRCSGET